jgi:general secretion pathway protein I
VRAAGQRAARGFTLIEVLVALMIVALGMGAVLSSLSSAADSTIRLREKTFASWVGFNQLAETRLKAAQPANGKSEGDVYFANARWHWQQEVDKTQVEGIKRITIQVRYADAAGAATPGNSVRSALERNSAPPDDWLATVVGFRGDAVHTPQSVLTTWP